MRFAVLKVRETDAVQKDRPRSHDDAQHSVSLPALQHRSEHAVTNSRDFVEWFINSKPHSGSCLLRPIQELCGNLGDDV